MFRTVPSTHGISLPSSRYKICPIDDTSIPRDWIKALAIEAFLLRRSSLWRPLATATAATSPTSTSLVSTALTALDLLDAHYAHSTSSGLSYCIVDTEYKFRKTSSASAGGALRWREFLTTSHQEGGNENLDHIPGHSGLIKGMDFPVVCIALSFDAYSPRDPETDTAALARLLPLQPQLANYLEGFSRFPCSGPPLPEASSSSSSSYYYDEEGEGQQQYHDYGNYDYDYTTTAHNQQQQQNYYYNNNYAYGYGYGYDDDDYSYQQQQQQQQPTAPNQVLIRSGCATKPGYEGKGLASALNRFVMAEMKSRGYRGICVGTSSESILRCYLGLGSSGSSITTTTTTTASGDKKGGKNKNNKKEDKGKGKGSSSSSSSSSKNNKLLPKGCRSEVVASWDFEEIEMVDEWGRVSRPYLGSGLKGGWNVWCDLTAG